MVPTDFCGGAVGMLFGQRLHDEVKGAPGLPVGEQVRAVLPVLGHAEPGLVRLGERGQRLVHFGEAGGPAVSQGEQAVALIAAARDAALYAYIVLSLLVGVRTEEARALKWDHVDLDEDPDAEPPVPPVPPHVAVWRSVRAHGDTKTKRSRRTLQLPRMAVEALRVQLQRQADTRLLAGILWQDNDLVFTTAVGTPLDASDVRRSLRAVCGKAQIGDDWAPRDMRHTFVSLLSDNGMAIEEISRLVGHSSTNVTETVYRHQLRPVITTGAEVMDKLFSGSEQ